MSLVNLGGAIPDTRITALAHRYLDDGRDLTVYQMLPGQYRLAIGPADAPCLDDFYCYDHGVDVLHAVAEWDGQGDPPGRWHRHLNTARRRRWRGHELVEEWVSG